METERYLRQSELLPVKKLQFHIDLIGAGSIGSFTAAVLAMMGCGNMTVWDGDCYEEHNFANQLALIEYKGKPKPDGVVALVKALTDLDIEARCEFFKGQKALSSVVIAAVDSITARKEIWEVVKRSPLVELFIDGRIGLDVAQMFVVRPRMADHVELYEASFFEEADTARLSCRQRGFAFCPQALAGCIGAFVVKYAQDTQRPILFESVMNMDDMILSGTYTKREQQVLCDMYKVPFTATTEMQVAPAF